MEIKNVLSLFDGMSCGQLALDKAGIKYQQYYASEIKPHAMKVTQHNYPNTIQLGDVTKIDSSNLPKIDLFIGGSPCQDFSNLNRVKSGLQGVKSGLFYEWLRLLREIQVSNPNVKFLLENVKMKKEWEDMISEELGVKPIRINSKLVSGFLRDRLYWTNIEGVVQPEDKGILLQDLLDYGFVERKKGLCMLESYSRPLKDPVKIVTRYLDKAIWQIAFKDEETYNKLKANHELAVEGDVRYLNHNEMERAQTVPDGYTSILSRNDAACLLGDGWTVDVIAHIFSFIPKKQD